MMKRVNRTVSLGVVGALCAVTLGFSGLSTASAADSLSFSYADVRVVFDANTSTISVLDTPATSLKASVRNPLGIVIDRANIPLASDFAILFEATVTNPAGVEDLILNGTLKGTDINTTLAAPSFAAVYVNLAAGADLDGVTFANGVLRIFGSLSTLTPPSILVIPTAGDWTFEGTDDAPAGPGSDLVSRQISVANPDRDFYGAGILVFFDIALPVFADGTSTSGSADAEALFDAALVHGGFDSTGGDLRITIAVSEPICGDGIVEGDEECDDGNNDDGDGCSATCTIEPFCGDGVVDDGEECDDGNNDDGDGCSATCTIEQCDLLVAVEGCVVQPPATTGDACDGKVTQLTLQYKGEGCSVLEHNQDPNKVTCIGDATFADPVRILVTDKNGDKVYADVPSVPLDGEVIAAAANAGENDFKAETRVRLYNADGDEIENVVFHTSCSQPLAPGNQFGSSLVVGMISTHGGEVGLEEPNTECITEFLPSGGVGCDGKLLTLELRYSGGDCSQTTHSQDPNKVSCAGDAGSAEPVRILVTNKNGNRVYGDVENVPLEGIVLAAAANGGKGKLDAETKVRVYNADGDLLQEIRFHTSCSQPLELGNQFGSLQIFGMETDKGTSGALTTDVTYTYTITNNNAAPITDVTVIDDVFGEVPGSPIAVIQPGEVVVLVLTASLLDTTTNTVTVTGTVGTTLACEATATTTVTAITPPEQGIDCCDDGNRLRTLSMVYTGADCSGTTHSQDPKKVSCDGDPMSEPVVRIQSSDKKNPDDHRARVWFDGQVALGDPFVIDAANAGKNKLKAKTFLHVYDLSGNLLQSIEFHTSCSQPLFEGDQFGSALLFTCAPEGGPVEGQFCVGGAKPRILTMKYDGADCSASSNTQNPDKLTCEGDPMLEPIVRIRASDKENLQDSHARVWFDGIVNVELGGQFDIDAQNAGSNKLKANTWVHIFDEDGNLLQKVEFHTSCSQPLNEGDRFGSLLLEAFVAE